MPEKPQEKKSVIEETEKSDEKPDEGDKSAWSNDQKKRSYYYDDACGYEIYEPDEDDEKK